MKTAKCLLTLFIMWKKANFGIYYLNKTYYRTVHVSFQNGEIKRFDIDLSFQFLPILFYFISVPYVVGLGMEERRRWAG